MDVGAVKLHLIEELLKVEDTSVLTELELVFAKNRDTSPRKSFMDIENSMTLEEVNEFERIIEEGCEQINPDDWK
ncbi:hypothetical protein [uncultured Mucilaginibacter sp.]|uniref:hypothetical protein n=1 Tax=uncultured Mucilaginibacter sp. TaxID=797541 RepID=UPI0025E82B7B|nr:hypothetical protein [uncultured Mucilaginibacter sp.]